MHPGRGVLARASRPQERSCCVSQPRLDDWSEVEEPVPRVPGHVESSQPPDLAPVLVLVRGGAIEGLELVDREDEEGVTQLGPPLLLVVERPRINGPRGLVSVEQRCLVPQAQRPEVMDQGPFAHSRRLVDLLRPGDRVGDLPPQRQRQDRQVQPQRVDRGTAIPLSDRPPRGDPALQMHRAQVPGRDGAGTPWCSAGGPASDPIAWA